MPGQSVRDACAESYARLRESKALNNLGLPKEVVVRRKTETYDEVHANGVRSLEQLRRRLSMNQAQWLGSKDRDHREEQRTGFMKLSVQKPGDADVEAELERVDIARTPEYVAKAAPAFARSSSRRFSETIVENEEDQVAALSDLRTSRTSQWISRSFTCGRMQRPNLDSIINTAADPYGGAPAQPVGVTADVPPWADRRGPRPPSAVRNSPSQRSATYNGSTSTSGAAPGAGAAAPPSPPMSSMRSLSMTAGTIASMRRRSSVTYNGGINHPMADLYNIPSSIMEARESIMEAHQSIHSRKGSSAGEGALSGEDEDSDDGDDEAAELERAMREARAKRAGRTKVNLLDPNTYAAANNNSVHNDAMSVVSGYTSFTHGSSRPAAASLRASLSAHSSPQLMAHQQPGGSFVGGRLGGLSEEMLPESVPEGVEDLPEEATSAGNVNPAVATTAAASKPAGAAAAAAGSPAARSPVPPSSGAATPTRPPLPQPVAARSFRRRSCGPEVVMMGMIPSGVVPAVLGSSGGSPHGAPTLGAVVAAATAAAASPNAAAASPQGRSHIVNSAANSGSPGGGVSSGMPLRPTSAAGGGGGGIFGRMSSPAVGVAALHHHNALPGRGAGSVLTGSPAAKQQPASGLSLPTIHSVVAAP